MSVYQTKGDEESMTENKSSYTELTIKEEQMLITGVKNGDVPFEDVLEQYKRLIWQYVHRHHPIAGHDVADLYSVGLGILFRCVNKFQIEQEVRFSTYLTTALNNRFIQLRQASKGGWSGAEHYESAIRLDRPVLGGEGEEATIGSLFLTTTMTSELNSRHFQYCLAKALKVQTQRFQEYFQLHFMEGLTYKEIAERYGIGMSGVRNYVVFHLPKLKEELVKQGISLA